MFNFSEIRFLFPFRVEKVEGGSVDSIVVKKALRDVPVENKKRVFINDVIHLGKG